jgi:acyl-coenzyme A synthetase/AMP-(fatty) acid ligase
VGIAVVFKPEERHLDEDELCTLIRDRLRSSRVPEQIRVLEELPYNEMGKLLRREVRSILQD